MTDEQDTSAEDDATPDEEVAPAGRTVEDVEREYQARLSGKDKAHNAEVAALKERLAEATRKEAAAPKAEVSKMADDSPLVAENARLQQELEQERKGRAIEARKTRFPTAADSLGDDLVASMDEERLAALESRLTSAPAPEPGGVLPNMASRTNGEPTVPKTEADLMADLRKYGPQWVSSLGE